MFDKRAPENIFASRNSYTGSGGRVSEPRKAGKIEASLKGKARINDEQKNEGSWVSIRTEFRF